MKKQNRLRELPEIIKTYVRGFLVMGAIVGVLSVIVLMMNVREGSGSIMLYS